MVVIYTLHPIMELTGAFREIRLGIGLRSLYPPPANTKLPLLVAASSTSRATSV